MKDTGKVSIHGKEYETVASRVQRFRQEHHDEYSIITEIISADEDRVVMKATIAKGRDPLGNPVSIATGFAEEIRASSSINRTSALENAETSAIGRALANFGMAGTEYASADEVAQAITQRSSPAPGKKPAVGRATATPPIDEPLPATKLQKARITSALRGQGVVDEEMAAVLQDDPFFVKDAGSMTFDEAVKVLGILSEASE